jgi:hypothetical protein
VINDIIYNQSLGEDGDTLRLTLNENIKIKPLIKFKFNPEPNYNHWLYDYKKNTCTLYSKSIAQTLVEKQTHQDVFKHKYNMQFNTKKGATTLIDRHLDEVTVVRTTKGDEYDKKMGFLLAYFQHTSGMSKTQCNKYIKELIK